MDRYEQSKTSVETPDKALEREQTQASNKMLYECSPGGPIVSDPKDCRNTNFLPQLDVSNLSKT